MHHITLVIFKDYLVLHIENCTVSGNDILQIVKAFIERQKLSVPAERVLQSADEDRTDRCRSTGTSAKLEECIVYNHVLISEVMYMTTSYKHPTTTNDHTVCLKQMKQKQQKSFGSALKQLSFCTDCTFCSALCTHVVVVNIHPILPCQISTDTITGATAQHINCIDQ